MLYRSTRNKLDSFTAYRTLRIDKASDGGCILPLRLPVLDMPIIEQMKKTDFLQNTADILNLFLGSHFTFWDMESTIGKKPLQIVECGQKIVLIQLWKNPSSTIDYYFKSIFSRLCSENGYKPTVWLRIAIRISLTAATILQLGENEIDFAVNVGDFEQAFATYYCRKMGIPIRKILVACNKNSYIWDFIRRGELHCGRRLQQRAYSAQDEVIPDLFEAYLFTAYGFDETQRFLDAVLKNDLYQLSEEQRLPTEDGLFASMIGQERIPAVISSFHSTNGVTVNPYTAFSLGVLQDYRAKAGESVLTVIFDEITP